MTAGRFGLAQWNAPVCSAVVAAPHVAPRQRRSRSPTSAWLAPPSTRPRTQQTCAHLEGSRCQGR